MTKAVLGSVAVMLNREQVNALLQMLCQLSAIDAQNAVSQSAQKVMQKILKYGRTFKTKGDEKVSIYFYDNEAVQLIRLTGLYLSAVQTNAEDYFDRIGLSRKKGLGHSQSTEQTVSGNAKN